MLLIFGLEEQSDKNRQQKYNQALNVLLKSSGNSFLQEMTEALHLELFGGGGFERVLP